MAGRINDEDVKAVRDAVPIDAVVSEYLQLRNAGGGNLKGLCPFHDEKSPSFQVSPSKGLFHCFGCQEGGDTITFVMKVDHLTFSESVERLAAQAGITLRYEEGGYNPAHQRGERIRLVEAHKIAAQWYMSAIWPWPRARIESRTCSLLVPAGISRPMMPAKTRSVAWPRIFGPTTLRPTLSTTQHSIA